MILLRLLPVFFAALFILTQTVNVKILKNEKLTVKINFNILAIVLTEDNKKRHGIKQALKLIKGARSTFKVFDYLLSKSNVKVFLNNREDIKNEKTTSIKNAYFIASTALVIPYIRTNSRSFCIIECSEKDKNQLELCLYFSLWHLIISALIFLYYIVKNKVKRVIKNV